jgi:hypothetical protein
MHPRIDGRAAAQAHKWLIRHYQLSRCKEKSVMMILLSVQVIYGKTGLSCDRGRSRTWERVLSCFYAVVSVLWQFLQSWRDLELCSGCASIALVDLKQAEAQAAAEELVEFAGTFSQFWSSCGYLSPLELANTWNSTLLRLLASSAMCLQKNPWRMLS